MSAEARLKSLGISLPPAPKAIGTYASVVRSGGLLFIAGQGPMVNGVPKYRGKLGAGITVEQGQDAARICSLNALALIREAVGSLDRVRRAVKATVYVASTDAFTEQPKIANGATELLRDLWGQEALPARVAVGVNVLPLDIPVELDLVVEVGDEPRGH